MFFFLRGQAWSRLVWCKAKEALLTALNGLFLGTLMLNFKHCLTKMLMFLEVELYPMNVT